MIRKYRPLDCEEVLEVWSRASALAHPFLDPGFLERERRAIADVYLPKSETWVWETNGHVAGFLSLLGSEIGGLFVDPEHHRSGIGKALVEQARALRGDLEVEVFERNRLGRAFYEALGFRIMRQKVCGETGFEVLRLRLAVGDQPEHANPGNPGTPA